MPVTEENRRRLRMIRIARETKWVLRATPVRLGLRRWLIGWLLRWLFMAKDETPHRAGEIVLAHLRDRFAGPVFDEDPVWMARKVGRREVVEEIFHLLNLDEAQVFKLMEVDDGL